MKSLKKALSFLLCAALLVGCGLVPALAEGADAGTPVPAAEGSFSFLNFNVAGLPSLTASSEKAARQKLLGQKVGADGYDIVAVQEDFGYDGDFAAGLGMPFRSYGPQSAAFGDGLNVFSKTAVYNVAREGWNKKGGMLWEGDIVSQKGVMLAVVELAPGVYVDVYNLHADAYGGQESIDARYDNFRQTMDFINAHSKEHPVIVTGDFNEAFHFGAEGRYFYSVFVEQLGFADVWAELANGGSYTDFSAWSGDYWGRWDSVECILYRSSDTVTLTPTSHRYVNYTDDAGNAISDHYAAAATFTYAASALASAEGLNAAKEEQPDVIRMVKIVFEDLRYIFSHFDEVTTLLKYMNDMEYLYTHYSR